MLVGNDDKFIGGLVVVNVEALQQAGFIDKEKVGQCLSLNVFLLQKWKPACFVSNDKVG
jgi:hypothetical protein